MYLAIIVLPLLGSIVSGFFGRKVGVTGAQFITSLCIGITTFIAMLVFYEVGLNGTPVCVYTFRWVDSESLNVLWGFNFDSLTVSMLMPVLIVSFLVHIYSIGYMSHDPHNQRFFSYLSLFTFMMIILVTANNFLLMFVGWEGVGVCSYLLVSFWFTRIAANQSSMSAFLTNRVGDCFLTLGMFTMLWTFGNLDYSTVFSLAPFINHDIVTIIGICILIGAMAKSSQIGLHVWLPLAMEGPTPVSALIHAATMVTAGVYLLMRTSPLIEYSSTVLILCLWIGGITTVFSSLIGLFQQDIKKVIAYSTMSQLGMMVIAVGLSSYNVALFHLVNHAFYKGLLFLGAGSVIHAVADNQDFRKYGGLLALLPLTYAVILIASLSLMAFPFMTGFYSKDFILESAFGQYQYSSIAIYFTASIGAIFTTLYSVKLLFITFLSNPNGPKINYNKAHEGDIFMSLPLVILALFSIFFGYLTKDMFIGLASGFFVDNSLFTHPLHEVTLNTEFAVPIFFKLLPLMFTVTFTICFLILLELLPYFIIHLKLTRLTYNTFAFFNLRFLVEYIYNRFITSLVLKLGGQTTKILDKGSIELLGPYGLEKSLISLSKNMNKLDTGVVTSYALYILIALVLYVLMPYMYSKDISVVLLMLFSLLISKDLFVSKDQPSKDKVNILETNVMRVQNDLKPEQNYLIIKSTLLSTVNAFFTKSFWRAYIFGLRTKFSYTWIISLLLTILLTYYFRNQLIGWLNLDLTKFTDIAELLTLCSVFSKVIQHLFEHISIAFGLCRVPMGPENPLEIAISKEFSKTSTFLKKGDLNDECNPISNNESNTANNNESNTTSNSESNTVNNSESNTVNNSESNTVNNSKSNAASNTSTEDYLLERGKTLPTELRENIAREKELTREVSRIEGSSDICRRVIIMQGVIGEECREIKQEIRSNPGGTIQERNMSAMKNAWTDFLDDKKENIMNNAFSTLEELNYKLSEIKNGVPTDEVKDVEAYEKSLPNKMQEILEKRLGDHFEKSLGDDPEKRLDEETRPNDPIRKLVKRLEEGTEYNNPSEGEATQSEEEITQSEEEVAESHGKKRKLNDESLSEEEEKSSKRIQR